MVAFYLSSLALLIAGQVPRPQMGNPVMGLWTLDNANLEQVAVACRGRHRPAGCHHRPDRAFHSGSVRHYIRRPGGVQRWLHYVGNPLAVRQPAVEQRRRHRWVVCFPD